MLDVPARQSVRAGALALACIIALAPAALCSAQCSYEVVGVIRGPQCPAGGRMPVTALDLNELGQVVGYVEGCAGSGVAKLPFVWESELGITLLDMPNPITDGEARAINNVPGADGIGVIACTLNHLGPQGDRAYRYDDNLWTILPPPFGFTYSAAHGVNDLGQIVGSRLTANGLLGFRWQNGVFTDLQFGLGNNPLPLGINIHGHAAGELAISQHAFKWDGNAVNDLGTVLGGDSAFVRRINDLGDMTGGAMVADGPGGTNRLHAFIIDGDDIIDVGVPDGFDATLGVDINNTGQVLVRCLNFIPRLDFRTYLWQHGDLRPLEDLVMLPPGIAFSHDSEAINDSGVIVTSGWENGDKVALVLAPASATAADVNADCTVDFFDIICILESWGPCAASGACTADVVTSATFQPPGDGKIDGADLAYILGSWSPAQ